MSARYGAIALAAALLAGCVAMDERECRSANWYDLGERDALIYGLRPQLDQYAAQCGRHGIQPDEKEYLTGWFYGERERDRRISGPED